MCLHCRITDRPDESLTFDNAKRVLDSFYNEGGRTVYFEGGESFLWRDGNYHLEDVVRYARDKGYFATVIYTKGTFPLETLADTVFVSVDGLKQTNDHLRGHSFDRVMDNIKSSYHPSLYVNFTINSLNRNEILDFCDYINNIHNIKGIFFYFHSTYYGYDNLYLERDQRDEILKMLIRNKRKYKILNSYAGLKSALKNDWERPLGICRIYEGDKIFMCCRFNGNEELCVNCGYLSYAGINQALKFKPIAIWNALKYF
jgi:MoaA/NifB/PqqE/SkfB family radical SAM enzyme